jgi:hypothetical protein
MTNKEKYISILSQVPNTQGLIAWLCETDFFTAPASTKYHGSHEGGLVEHSLNVYVQLLMSENANRFSKDSIIKVALLHDLCKVNFYSVDYRNAKINGQWERVPYYCVKDEFPYGHGEKSVLFASRFIELTTEETMAIRWHMGAFDDAVKSGFNLSQVYEKYPLALELHIADLRATYFLEKEKENE